MLNAIPTSNSLLNKSKIPLGLVIMPYRLIKEGEGLVPASQEFGVCSPGRILAMERSTAAAVVHIGPSYLNVYFYE